VPVTLPKSRVRLEQHRSSGRSRRFFSWQMATPTIVIWSSKTAQVASRCAGANVRIRNVAKAHPGPRRLSDLEGVVVQSGVHMKAIVAKVLSVAVMCMFSAGALAD